MFTEDPSMTLGKSYSTLAALKQMKTAGRNGYQIQEDGGRVWSRMSRSQTSTLSKILQILEIEMKEDG